MTDSLDSNGAINEGLKAEALRALFALKEARPDKLECWPHPALELPRPEFNPWPIPEEWQRWVSLQITVGDTTAATVAASLISQIQETICKGYAEERTRQGLPVIPDSLKDSLPDDIRAIVESGEGGIMPAEVTAPIVLHALISSIWPLLGYAVAQLAGGIAASDDKPGLLQERDKEATHDVLAQAAAYLMTVLAPRALVAAEELAEKQQLAHLGREAAKL